MALPGVLPLIRRHVTVAKPRAEGYGVDIVLIFIERGPPDLRYGALPKPILAYATLPFRRLLPQGADAAIISLDPRLFARYYRP